MDATAAALILLLMQVESTTRIGVAFLTGEVVTMTLLTLFAAFIRRGESVS